jgi:hypothetical protein
VEGLEANNAFNFLEKRMQWCMLFKSTAFRFNRRVNVAFSHNPLMFSQFYIHVAVT